MHKRDVLTDYFKFPDDIFRACCLALEQQRQELKRIWFILKEGLARSSDTDDISDCKQLPGK